MRLSRPPRRLFRRPALVLALVLPVLLPAALPALAQQQQGSGGTGEPGIGLPRLPDWIETFMHWTARGVELVGVAIIVLGAVYACIRLVQRLVGRLGGDGLYHGFRADLGRAILLGLEFLVAADIIGTVAVAPTMDNLLILGLIVLIRTFLSTALQVEIEGRWPWRAKMHAVRGHDDHDIQRET